MYDDPSGHISQSVNGMMVYFEPSIQEDQDYVKYVYKESAKTPKIKDTAYYTDRFYTEKAVIQAYDLLDKYRSDYTSYRLNTGYDLSTGQGMNLGLHFTSPEDILNEMDAIQMALLTNKAIGKKEAIFKSIFNSFANGQVMSPSQIGKLRESLRSDPWYDKVISDKELGDQIEGLRVFSSITLDIMPVIGQAKGLLEFGTGYDYVAGSDVGTVGRVATGLGTVAPLLKGLKYLGKVGSFAEEASVLGDSFIKTGRTSNLPNLKIGKLYRELNSSPIGRQILEYMKANNTKGIISYNWDIPEGLTGRAYSDNSFTIFAKNTQSYSNAARTSIHEVTHLMGVQGSRRAEMFARIRELKHIYPDGKIPTEVLKQEFDFVKKAYSDLPAFGGERFTSIMNIN